MILGADRVVVGTRIGGDSQEAIRVLVTERWCRSTADTVWVEGVSATDTSSWHVGSTAVMFLDVVRVQDVRYRVTASRSAIWPLDGSDTAVGCLGGAMPHKIQKAILKRHVRFLKHDIGREAAQETYARFVAYRLSLTDVSTGDPKVVGSQHADLAILGQLKRYYGDRLLLHLAKSPYPLIRRDVLRLTARDVSDPKAARRAAAALFDPSSRVQAAAADLLTISPVDSVRFWLRRGLKSSGLGHDSRLPQVNSLTLKNPRSGRVVVVESIAATKDTGAIYLLRSMLFSNDAQEFAAVLSALSALGDSTLISSLKTFLAHNTQWCDESARPTGDDCLSFDAKTARMTAVRFLAETDEPEALRIVEAVFADHKERSSIRRVAGRRLILGDRLAAVDIIDYRPREPIKAGKGVGTNAVDGAPGT
ncbi:MAG: hypothetical protein QGH20_08655 [Candidatus Latescibacteria bacterium]|nr:hypothetical protein [Candidatus Latescibacterota bacterium]